MWGLVWDHRAGRGSGQAEQIREPINLKVELYSPRQGVRRGWLFSLHPGNFVKLYNQERNLLIRAQAKLILLFILLQGCKKKKNPFKKLGNIFFWTNLAFFPFDFYLLFPSSPSVLPHPFCSIFILTKDILRVKMVSIRCFFLFFFFFFFFLMLKNMFWSTICMAWGCKEVEDTVPAFRVLPV